MKLFLLLVFAGFALSVQLSCAARVDSHQPSPLSAMADADPAVSSAPGDWTHLSELAADAHIYVTIRDGSQASGRFKQLTEESLEVTLPDGY